MSKFKIAIITGTILIIVGIVGVIPSGLNMTKEVLADINSARNEKVSTENYVTLYEEEKEIENIKVVSDSGVYDTLNVEIKKSNDNKFSIKKHQGWITDIDINSNYDESSKTISININSKRDVLKFYRENKGVLENIYDETIYALANNRKVVNGVIEIYVPNSVNIDVESNRNIFLKVADEEVLGDNLDYNSNMGGISLPKFNKCKNISINSNDYVELDVREFINAEKVNISGSYVDINSHGGYLEYDGLNKFPEEINIITEYLSVDSYIQLANKIVLDVGHSLNIEMPFDEYNVFADINAKSDNVYLSGVNGAVIGGKFTGELSNGANGRIELIVKSCYYGEIENVSRSNLNFDMD